MKKKLLILFLLLFFPFVVSAQNATLVKNGVKKVVEVGSQQAQALFGQGYKLDNSGKKLGYNVVTDFKTTLAASMTSVQSTISLSSITTKDGHVITMNDLGGKVYLTLEPGGSKEEIIKCTTVSGTGFASCTRGLAFYGNTETTVAGNRYTHNAGSVVVMSNVQYVYKQFVDKDSDESIDGVKTFLQIPIGTSTIPTSSNQIVTKAYVDATAIAGAPRMSTTTLGIGYISSNPSDALSPTVLNNEEVATSSGASKVIKANTSGKIDPSWLNGTEDYTFNGTTTFNSTTTFNGITNFATSTSINGTIINAGVSTFLGAGDATANKEYWNYMMAGISDLWTASPGFGFLYKYNYITQDTPRADEGTLTFPIINSIGEKLTITPASSTNMIIEFDAKYTRAGASTSIIGLGTTAYGMYFLADTAEKLYAVNQDSSLTRTEITGITLTNINKYRIEYNPGVSSLFYVNGVLKATHTNNFPALINLFTLFKSSGSESGFNSFSAPMVSIKRQ